MSTSHGGVAPSAESADEEGDDDEAFGTDGANGDVTTRSRIE
jgi:hypothetical protein